MPTIQQRDGRFQLRVKHKLLPKPFFSTFDTHAEAEAYGDRLVLLLKSGIVPQELAVQSPRASDPLMEKVIETYRTHGPITDSDAALLETVIKDVTGLRVSSLTNGWVDTYVRRLKLTDNISPGTIRKKVGVLGRVMGWHIRRSTQPGDTPLPNSFRELPRGYSVYSTEEAAALKDGKTAKRDVQRERRLHPGEEERILAVLRGQRPEGDNRKGVHAVLKPRPELEMLFRLIVDTGLRLSEAYGLRADQLELDKGFARVNGSKGHRGSIKPRVVPLKPSLVAVLREYAKDRVGLLFPFWTGRKEDKKIATRDLVQLFGRTFRHARVPSFTEHDLRHEACCRWFELRGHDGRWVFSDVEICRILGWSDYSMVLRYASIRGEDMAARFAQVAPPVAAQAAPAVPVAA